MIMHAMSFKTIDIDLASLRRPNLALEFHQKPLSVKAEARGKKAKQL